MQLAAISCARRPPPSSNASTPVTTTVPAAISAAGIRSTVNEPGAIPPITCAISGVSGPWSGNAQSR